MAPRWRTCYVCGGYSRGARHRACKPAYIRRRYHPCAVCGEQTRGEMHKRCRFPDAGRTCNYCKLPVKVSRDATGPQAGYHRACRPSRPQLAIFADLPTTIQQRCSHCGEWYPFASTVPTDEDVAADYWPMKRDRRGPVREAVCRSCAAQRRYRPEVYRIEVVA
jgi:hypothetical protein